MNTDLPRGLSHAVSAKSMSPNPEKYPSVKVFFRYYTNTASP